VQALDDIGVQRVHAIGIGVQAAAGVPELQGGGAAARDVLQRDHVIQELGALAATQGQVLDGKDHELFAAQLRPAEALLRHQLVDHAVAVKVGLDARQVGQRVLAVNRDDVLDAVKVGV